MANKRILWYFTYKKPGDQAKVSTFDTKEEAVAKQGEALKHPSIEVCSGVDFGVDEMHCIAKAIMFWGKRGYTYGTPQETMNKAARLFVLPERAKR